MSVSCVSVLGAGGSWILLLSDLDRIMGWSVSVGGAWSCSVWVGESVGV